MTLPNSGALALSQIQSEFGGSNPIAMNEYYRGGSYVPTHSGTSGIPASGTIAINQFYGKSDAAPTDSSVSGTCGGTNQGKFSTQQRGIQVYQYGTDFPAHGSWSDASFTNSSGNITFAASRISVYINNITNTPTFQFEITGSHSGNFNSKFGYNVLKVGNTTLANGGTGSTYNNTNSTTQFAMNYVTNTINTVPSSGNHTFNFHS